MLGRIAHRTLIALSLAASLLQASVARADEPSAAPPEQRAQAHFQRGIERYDDAEYALALVEFERAYALSPGYQLLFNIGQVHYQLHQYAKARGALEEYLAQGRDKLGSERRAEVEQQLLSLRSRTAELRITLNVPGAEVSVNEEVIGTSPLVLVLLVDAGKQRVVASKPGFASTRSTVVVVGGEVAAVDLALLDLSADAASSRGNLPATLSWLSAGVLGVAAIGTGVATLLASSRYDEMRNERFDGSAAAARRTLDEQESLVSTLATTTDILAGASLAAAGLGLYLTLRAAPATDTPARVQGRVGPSGLQAWLEF